MRATLIRLSLRRLVLLVGLAAAVVAPVILAPRPAAAAEARAFDAAAFAAAQAAGRPILVEVTAPWCSVCAKQKPILAALQGRPEFKDLAVFTVDFDSQKDVVRSLKVGRQSTLITFRGRQETARSTGETNPAAIEAQLKTLART